MTRYLTQAEADRCENAREPVCKCRCGGAKHGAARVPSGGDFSTLAMDDPHYRPPMTKKEVKKFLHAAELAIIIAPSPNLPNESWTDTRRPWKWRHDAYAIIRKAKGEL